MAFSFFSLPEFEAAIGDGDKKEAFIKMAKIAEAAERYEDMCQFMRKRVEMFPDSTLNQEERNLLSVAYKNVIGSRRASWRTLVADEATEYTPIYTSQVETELKNISQDVLKLLEDFLINKDLDTNPPSGVGEVEEQVFYLKMAGDYYRYLTESIGDNADEYKEKCSQFYKKASDITTVLSPTHPIRLGLALNYSVCYYEILKNPVMACKLAKEAFDQAISQLDTLKDSDYKDATLIMQLLRDNLTLWASSNGSGEGLAVEDLEQDDA